MIFEHYFGDGGDEHPLHDGMRQDRSGRQSAGVGHVVLFSSFLSPRKERDGPSPFARRSSAKSMTTRPVVE
jgi:hypothetical protein